MLQITQLEKKYHEFYAPAYEVLINGENLLTKELVEITTVQVDSTLEGMDQFSFTVNSSFDFARQEFATRGGYNRIERLFAFGNEVEIRMGYRDVARQPILHRGMITAVKTGFPSSGLPQITVSGYDRSYCMKHKKRSRTWDKTKDSVIAAKIAGDYGLTPDVQDSLIEHPRTEQNQQTDQEFLKHLAKGTGFEVFTFDRTLSFKKPDQGRTAAITLEWGKGLVSFTPDINISEQVTQVKVSGWDVKAKKPIIGIAKKGDELGRDRDQKSGGEVLKAACKEEQETTFEMRYPVRSQEEAVQKAKAILKSRSELFVKGSGESIGIPDIRPNTNIELLGLGKLFSKTYLVEQATHTISTSGYRTTFKVKETTIEARGAS